MANRSFLLETSEDDNIKTNFTQTESKKLDTLSKQSTKIPDSNKNNSFNMSCIREAYIQEEVS